MPAKKCAHDTCDCVIPEGSKSKYCSNFCEDSKGLTTLRCDCGHPPCTGQTF
jgi:hypothetical protein